jgi:hypothetical protein
MDLPSHAILDRGRVLGLWEYDPDTASIAWCAFGAKDKAMTEAVKKTEALSAISWATRGRSAWTARRVANPGSRKSENPDNRYRAFSFRLELQFRYSSTSTFKRNGFGDPVEFDLFMCGSGAGSHAWNLHRPPDGRHLEHPGGPLPRIR